ncbi:WhiB family transcriptional regulator [Streptomyces sp. 769]|nr:WhiB family transcriptional regulator [Streptomyces sp. 769]
MEGFVKAFTFTSNVPVTRGDGAAMDWRHRAVCREEDPELFFPIGNTGPALLQIEEAKAVCRRCPVMEQCLQWALESGQDSGVWGGLSEDERRAMKRRAARNRARNASA